MRLASRFKLCFKGVLRRAGFDLAVSKPAKPEMSRLYPLEEEMELRPILTVEKSKI